MPTQASYHGPISEHISVRQTVATFSVINICGRFGECNKLCILTIILLTLQQSFNQGQ
jgi:hypothetical protein